MERSGWPDDDDSSPVPPRDQRAWRHPSELGRLPAVVPTPGCARRRSTGRFAFAVAAGTAGTLAVASIAVVTIGNDHKRATPPVTDVVLAGSFGGASSVLTTLYAPGAPRDGDELSAVSAVSTTLVDRLSAPTAVSRPAVPTVVALQRPDDSTQTVAAVIIDDGTVWAVAADVVGTDRLETTVGGETVTLAVDVPDAETGLVQLHPTKPLVVTPPSSVAWLGVNCSDEYVNRSPSTSVAGSDTNANASQTSVGATSSLPTVVASPAGSTSVAAPVTTIASPIRAATSARTAQTAATATATQTTVVRGVATSVAPAIAGRQRPAEGSDAPSTPSGSTVDTTGVTAPTTIAASTAGAVTSASNTTIVDDITSVASTAFDKPEATSSPSTVAWPQGDAAAAGSQMRGVHVHDVVHASPADKGGVRRGDVILAADGRPVRTVWALVLAIRRHAVGDEINVLVRRDGSLVTLPMVLANRPDGST